MKAYDSNEPPTLIHRISYHVHHHLHQILAVAGATCTLFATGNIMGFSSVTIPELLDPESTIKVDHDDLSWIASLVTIGGFMGTITGGLLSDLLGRKTTIMMSSLIFFIGWIIIGFANSVTIILIGRLLNGIASGLYSTSVQVYICEIVDPSIRGISGSIPTLMVSIGVLVMYIVGSLIHWRTLAFVSSVFPIIVLIYMNFLPESPVWLLSKGYVTSAINSLTWLKNDYDEAEDEIFKLKEGEVRRRSSSGGSDGKRGLRNRLQQLNRKNIYSCCSRFSEKSVLKPLGIGFTLFFFQKFCGVSAITFYATLIFQYADNMNNYTETIIVGFVRIVSNLIGIFLIKFFKRKPLLIASALIMCVSNGCLGIYFFTKDKYGQLGEGGSILEGGVPGPSPVDESFVQYSIECIPLICVTVFMLGSSVGFAVIPWFLVAELLPSDVRSLSCSMAYAFCQLCQFTSIKTFLNMLDTFNTFGTFWIYSVIAFIGALFVVFFVPETSNMHAADIEKLFSDNAKEREGGGGVRRKLGDEEEGEDDELTPLKRKQSLMELLQKASCSNNAGEEDDDEDGVIISSRTNCNNLTSRLP